MAMSTMIDLTETSSDEEDSPSTRKASVTLPAASHSNGAPKKQVIMGLSATSGRIAPENGQPLNGRAGNVWKGMRMGKNEAALLDEVHRASSPGFSGWGDPLPPETGFSHSPNILGSGENSSSPSPSILSPVENGGVSAGVPPVPIPVAAPSSSIAGNGVPHVPTQIDEQPNSSVPIPISNSNGSPHVGDGLKTAPVPPVGVPFKGSRFGSGPKAAAADDDGVCRQFWRAGDYEAKKSGVKSISGAMDHVRVHPKFLHSNATSHKWALGAVAELLDNAVDEVHNGATFVNLDKILNPRDGSAALLVQDDGGGMTPDTMRACMSLGYSRKNTNTTIGQYGNGFKTSTMRLGADVVVFSRNVQGSMVTQSIGLLSYTFLRKTGREDVVVPMVDWEFSPDKIKTGEQPRRMIRSSLEDWQSNLASIMQWCPYATEGELLQQFEDVGWHGTKVVVYNLWFNDDGVLELDFETDEFDIQLRGGTKTDKAKPVQHQLLQQHVANRYHHSLRVYTSILYLQMPQGFQIILRGKPVDHHSIASDLKFAESIVYKPQIGQDKESTASVITIIGFTKEAPLINVHGFNVYHKNRLIMPFWKVWQENSSRGRGVVGVLEANFVEPAHDKQDFERTAVLLRLETRLKQMTVEYWNLHCHLIGYQPNTKAGKAARKQSSTPAIEYPTPIASIPPTAAPKSGAPATSAAEPASVTSMAPGGSHSPPANGEGPKVKTEPGEGTKRTNPLVAEAMERYKRQKTSTTKTAMEVATGAGVNDGALIEQPSESDAMIIDLIQENSQLKSRCVDYELDVKKLASKVMQLEKELLDARMKNVNLQDQLQKVALPSATRPHEQLQRLVAPVPSTANKPRLQVKVEGQV